MDKKVFPEYYNEKDKAIYYDLYNKGESLLGKRLSKNDEFLIDLAIHATIKQMKGLNTTFTPEEVAEMKIKHKEMTKQGLMSTPPDIFYDNLLVNTETGETYQHPLSKTSNEYYNENMHDTSEPVETIEVEEIENTSNISINTSNIDF
jgi:hypothetical protein